MESLFDGLEIFIIVAWIAFSMFGTKIFQKKNKKDQKHEYPEFPQDDSPADSSRSDQDVSEEERKLKEWLEKVFGAEETEEGQPAEESSEEPVYQEEVPAQQEPAVEYYSKPKLSPQQVDLKAAAASLASIENNPVRNKWQGRLGKKQMAYGFVMAEIFQKPLALRPKQKVFMKKNNLL